MTKPAKIILIVSIAANAVLLAGLATGYVSIIKSSTANTRTGPVDIKAISPEAAGATKALLTMDDMAALRDKLRALGLPESMTRLIVEARIESRDMPRQREIRNAALQAARERPYWQPRRVSVSGLFGTDIFTPAQQKEMREMDREQSRETMRLFGSDAAKSFAAVSYAFLSPEKLARMDDLESDYRDLRDQALNEMAGFRMPGDEEKLKVLDEEKKRDTLALMTPEEREMNDLRNSSTAYQLRRNLSGLDTTEDEYKAIFALQHAQEEKYPSKYELTAYGGADLSEYAKARDEDQKNVDAQIKDLLGEERYADYVRGQRQDYQTLLAAAERFNLSAETVAQTYQMRTDAANEAQRISDDASLSTAQKNEAYAALSEQAMAQIKAALGDDVGAAYIDNALGWLKNLPKGGTVKIGPKGNVNVTQPKGGKK